MDSKAVLYSWWGNDECYTPRYGVIPIVKYLPKDKIIWCPFDTEESEFVKVLREEWFTITLSHISGGGGTSIHTSQRNGILS